MKLGVNSVLFGGYDLETAFRWAAGCGYDGIELAAIESMAPQHLVPQKWKSVAPQILQLKEQFGLELLAMEQPSQDPLAMTQAIEAAAALGIPIINCGPGGTTDDEQSFKESIRSLADLAKQAGDAGVTLCVKAHVGQAIYNTATTQRMLEEIQLDSFGLDMDPSHIHRAGEDPVAALGAVVTRIKHVHIRDCRGRQQGPGDPEDQANGRGDIDLVGYVRVLHEAGYAGPVDLEIIGAKDYALERCIAIAAESRGHLQASLQACGAR